MADPRPKGTAINTVAKSKKGGLKPHCPVIPKKKKKKKKKKK
jgi:hypothetical protein